MHDRAGRCAVVHRPRYDDWSLPKGKLEPGEPYPVAAVRECREETGLRVRLEAPLPEVTYRVAGAPKVVRYWRAAICSDEGFVPGAEVDALRWVAPADAARVLTRPADARIVERSAALGPTCALVLLRHAAAVAREDWGDGPGAATGDEMRPLTHHGHVQAAEVATLLDCYGLERIVSSPALRCRQSVDPLAALTTVALELDDRYSEHHVATDPATTSAATTVLAGSGERTVLCTHRPVLPIALTALHLGPGPPLDPAAAVVVHRYADGTTCAWERHEPA